MKTKTKNKLQDHMTPALFKQLRDERNFAWDQFSKIQQRCKALEKQIKEAREEAIAAKQDQAGAALAAAVNKQKLDQIVAWAQLKRPDLLKLHKQFVKHSAAAAYNLAPAVVLKPIAKRAAPRIYESWNRTVWIADPKKRIHRFTTSIE